MLVAVMGREGVVGKRSDDDDIGANFRYWWVVPGLVRKRLRESFEALGDILAANSVVVELKVSLRVAARKAFL